MMQRRRIFAGGAVLLLLCAGAVLRAQLPLDIARDRASADLVLTNGKIITVDERFTIAQAVAIKGDRVVAVGTNQQVGQLAGPATRRIDLRGRSVVPGLIDNHMHLLRAGTTWTREVRLDGVESRKQALDLFAARAKAIAPGDWVYTIGGWSVDQFADSRAKFTRELTDAVSGLVARYHDADAPSGRAYRLIVMAHPLPRAGTQQEDA